MDPDMQFNALAALSQSVTHDLKQSFPAWDMVAQKAVKLSQQLRSTAQCLTSFCDALQNVSDDCGSNLKGATRDVATCLTRISMRQRALESRFRSLADAFSEELARGLSERTNYWKQRAAELEKTNVKHIKKVRGRKKRPDGPSLSEQKQICTQILGEQRQNFQFFCSMLMPVLKAEMTLLDEGPHIRQAVETLETTIECVDSTALVDTIVTDITQGVDGAWKQCLDNATLRFREKSLTGSEFDLTPMSRPQSLPVSENGIIHGGEGVLASKPPRRPISRSNSKSSCISPPLNQSPLSDSMFNMSQFGPGRLMRPHSINGMEPYGTHQPPVPMQSGPGSCSSEASAAMYSETLQQIDQLGSDLENFCTSAFDMRYITDPIPPNQATPYNSNIKMREHSKPPPPARRNSTITAATPTAPSVADARSNYFKGSRQSLNSSLYSGSTTDLHHHPVNSQPHPMTPMAQNVNPYNKHSTFTPNYNL